mmetsp:Transcript_3086/g.4747  ORF Transcript_3086/g.4747 Transcript_3086/m.4747 type:complete len:347 (+) Transcript_3086:389-1429(+)
MLMFLSGISSSKTTSQYEDITDDSDHFEVQDMESSGASTGESAEDVINTDPPQSNARFAHYPIYTVGMIIVQLSLYIYGIYYLIGVNNVEYSRYQPISPPNRNLMFDTVSRWPYCSDNRDQYLRLWSHQFVHAGYLHVCSNQFMAFMFGVLLEGCQGLWRTLIVYQLGVLGGALCHASVWPYRALIGCSHGVYAMYGACFSELILNVDTLHPVLGGFLAFTLIIQLASDVLAFVFWFNPSVGYAAHVGGFLSGLLLGFVIFSAKKIRIWKYLICVLACTLYVPSVFILAYRYETTWPPSSIVTPTWSSLDTQPCCAELFSMRNQSFIDSGLVEEYYYCDGGEVIPT